VLLGNGKRKFSCSDTTLVEDVLSMVSEPNRFVFGCTGYYYASMSRPRSKRRPALYIDDFEGPASFREAINETKTEITVDPHDVRFLHDSISIRFRTGGTIYNLASDLACGRVDVSDIPKIRVIMEECSEHQTLIWGLDHRRLWVFKAGGVTSVLVELVHMCDYPVDFKENRTKALASPAGGFSIKVRTTSRFA